MPVVARLPPEQKKRNADPKGPRPTGRVWAQAQSSSPSLSELELLFAFELLSEPHDAADCIPFPVSQASSSAATRAVRNEVAIKATVATLA
jgi:hypothetical protein